LERDVQVVVCLRLELEGLTRGFEEGEVRAVIEPIEGVQSLGRSPRLRLRDLERRDQGQAQKSLVKLPCLFRVPAAVGVVVQSFDHDSLAFGWRRQSAPRVGRATRGSVHPAEELAGIRSRGRTGYQPGGSYGGGQIAGSDRQIVTKGMSLTCPAKPYSTSLTLPQLLSCFIVLIQRLTFGYLEKSQSVSSPSVIRQTPK